MKGILLLFFLFISSSCFSQSQWYGDWDVHCGVAGIGEGPPKVCEICPVTGGKESDNYRVTGFWLNIKKDSVEITVPYPQITSTTVHYSWDEIKQNMSFSYKGKDYTFHTSAEKDENVFTDTKGYSLYLSRKK